MMRAAVSVIGLGLLLLIAAPALAADELVAFIDVAGAPGDGEQALASALKRRLAAKGVKSVNRPAVGVYEVQGTVRMSPATRGKETIRIHWTVFGPEGTRLGNITQTRIVRKGSLDRRWGAAADMAAGAAAKDILKLLPQQNDGSQKAAAPTGVAP
jgi:hypothetical protein